MIFVEAVGITDPRVNLAIEEHLLRNVRLDEPILLFYINEPSVIIGRNQNTIEEIDPDYINSQGIHVVRRLSGGGAVYHDLGNLNFSFITSGSENLHNFAKFTQPVIEVLAGLGVGAELRGRSDIFAGGKKISGNAQYATSGRMFSHGTLLFNTDLEQMLKALNPRQVEIESRAVSSIRNFVTNIRELLAIEIDIYGLKEAIIRGIFGQSPIPTYELTSDDWSSIEEISGRRYRLWAWNYGRSPRYDLRKSADTPAGRIDIHINVVSGLIQDLRIYGNFSGKRQVAELEKLLIGVRYDRDHLADGLEEVDLVPYFGDIKKADFLALLF
jgi:lipoate-protein ligase A